MELDILASDFFKTFARFKYALKASGYHSGDGEAKSNWYKFAKSVEKLFEEPASNEFREAIQYLIDNPPKKQMINAGDLKWCEAPPSTNLKSNCVLLYIRRVRNNLFHGGKFNGHWFESERSEKLMRHSLRYS